MLSIESILKFIHSNLSENRFKKLDEEHIMDEKTGIEIHMYDDWFKITKGDEVIATMGDFTSKEQEIIWAIRQTVVDPSVAQMKEANYHKDMAARRTKLSSLFENPKPVVNKEPTVEQGTLDYKG